jgi:hypothetical protein
MDSYRDRARRRTRRVQGLAVVLLTCAGAAAALPLPRLFGPTKWPPSPPTGITHPPPPPPPAASIDTKKMAEVLVATAGKAPDKPAAAAPDKSKETAETHPIDRAPLRYLGWVAGPRVKAANLAMMVGTEEKQKFVSEGATINGLKLVSIEADHVTLENAAGAPQRIDLAPPSHSWSQEVPVVQMPGPQQPPQDWSPEAKKAFYEAQQRAKGQPPVYPPNPPAPVRQDLPMPPVRKAPVPPGKESPKDGA